MAYVGDKANKVKKVKKTASEKRPLNPYMLAKEKARKNGADTFEYKGTTYYKMTMKTGMVAYTKNKGKANK
jgi:hypothetical protein